MTTERFMRKHYGPSGYVPPHVSYVSRAATRADIDKLEASVLRIVERIVSEDDDEVTVAEAVRVIKGQFSRLRNRHTWAAEGGQ